MVVREDRVYLLAGQKRLEGKYKDANMLPKVNKTDTAGTMEAAKEYLRSYHGVMRVPLVYLIRTTTSLVQVYADYPKFATPKNKMITRMLHCPPDKNRLHNE